MIRFRQIIREAVASARSGPVASTLTVLVVAGMVLAVMLTTGRTVGAEQRVLASIDSAGTRSIIVRADNDAGVTSDIFDRIDRIEGIEWAGAFSSAIDATNSLVQDGTKVPVRFAYGNQFDRLGIPVTPPSAEGVVAYATPQALEQLGLPDTAGAITLMTGIAYGIGGRIDAPDFLSIFEPLVLVPSPEATGEEPVNVIVVIAARPELVGPVADAVSSVLAATDPSKVTVQTSESLAQLRTLIEGQLGTFSRGLVLALLLLTGAVVAILLYGLVMMRRKDYGRRRALGATRTLIMALLLTQTGLLALVGTTIGTIGAVIVLLVFRDPLPGWAFTGALTALSLVTALVAALVPALVASSRDPIKELRVP